MKTDAQPEEVSGLLQEPEPQAEAPDPTAEPAPVVEQPEETKGVQVEEEGVRGGAAGSWVPTLAAAAANGSTSGSSFFFGDTHSTGASGGRKRGRQARDQVSGARKLTSRGRGGPGRIFTSSPVGRAQDAEVSSDNTTLYVGNLPPGTEAAALRAAVSAYPGMDDAIKEVRVPPGKDFENLPANICMPKFSMGSSVEVYTQNTFNAARQRPRRAGRGR